MASGFSEYFRGVAQLARSFECFKPYDLRGTHVHSTNARDHLERSSHHMSHASLGLAWFLADTTRQLSERELSSAKIEDVRFRGISIQASSVWEQSAWDGGRDDRPVHPSYAASGDFLHALVELLSLIRSGGKQEVADFMLTLPSRGLVSLCDFEFRLIGSFANILSSTVRPSYIERQLVRTEKLIRAVGVIGFMAGLVGVLLVSSLLIGAIGLVCFVLGAGLEVLKRLLAWRRRTRTRQFLP